MADQQNLTEEDHHGAMVVVVAVEGDHIHAPDPGLDHDQGQEDGKGGIPEAEVVLTTVDQGVGAGVKADLVVDLDPGVLHILDQDHDLQNVQRNPNNQRMVLTSDDEQHFY